MNVDQKPILNKKVIERWRIHLLDRESPRFNIDYPILEHEGRDGDPKRFEGDPGFILAYFTELPGVENDTQLSAWMSDKQTEVLINIWTGIPLDDARKLVEPSALWQVNYPTRSITAKQFVSVLDTYLETGLVLWEKVILENPKFQVAPEDLPAETQPEATPA